MEWSLLTVDVVECTQRSINKKEERFGYIV